MTAKKILLIDDTPRLAQSIAEMLHMEGFDVTVCHSGFEAFSFLNENSADLVITDLRMNGMDGLDITRRIRNTKALESIPIIILTADTNKDNEKQSREAGANLLLHKPFDEEHLLKCIYQITQNDK